MLPIILLGWNFRQRFDCGGTNLFLLSVSGFNKRISGANEGCFREEKKDDKKQNTDQGTSNPVNGAPGVLDCYETGYDYTKSDTG
jgi:hypothetical protein